MQAKKPQYSELPDEQVVRLAQQEPGATAYLLEKYKPLVLSRSRSYFLAGADREDITQEGMIGLYKAIRDFKEDMSSFSAFAELCITRQIISAIKMANRQKHKPLNSYVSLSRPAFGEEPDNEWVDFVVLETLNDPERIFLDHEQMDTLLQSIDVKLSPLEMQVFTYYMDGLTYSEIAAKTGKPEKSVDNALQRIKGKVAGLFKTQ